MGGSIYILGFHILCLIDAAMCYLKLGFRPYDCPMLLVGAIVSTCFKRFDAYCCWKRLYMLKNARLFIQGFFMEVKVDHNSDIEGSSIFLSSILNFYVLMSLLVGSF